MAEKEEAFDDLEDDRKLLRIETRSAQYREFLADDQNIDSTNAYDFAGHAVEDYLPWCVERIRKLELLHIKAEMRAHRAESKLRKLASPAGGKAE